MMSWVRRWVGCLLKDSELFILYEENSQILLKLSVIPSPFHVSGSTESVYEQPTQLIAAKISYNSGPFKLQQKWKINHISHLVFNHHLQRQGNKHLMATLVMKPKASLKSLKVNFFWMASLPDSSMAHPFFIINAKSLLLSSAVNLQTVGAIFSFSVAKFWVKKVKTACYEWPLAWPHFWRTQFHSHQTEIFPQEFEPASYFCDSTCDHLIMS